MNKFAQWIERKGIKQRFIASKLGVSTSTLHGIIRSGHTPSLRLAYDIEVFTRGDITVYDWIDFHNDTNDIIKINHAPKKIRA